MLPRGIDDDAQRGDTAKDGVKIAVWPVDTVAESLADPQIHAGEMVEELRHLSTAPSSPRGLAPI